MIVLWSSLILLGIALVLSFFAVYREGFIGSPDAQKCGVDQPPCPFGQACLNGYCHSDYPPALPKNTGLPVFP